MQYLVFMAAGKCNKCSMVVHSRSSSHSWITFKCQCHIEGRGFWPLLMGGWKGETASVHLCWQKTELGARFCLIWKAQCSQKYNTDNAKMFVKISCVLQIVINLIFQSTLTQPVQLKMQSIKWSARKVWMTQCFGCWQKREYRFHLQCCSVLLESPKPQNEKG